MSSTVFSRILVACILVSAAASAQGLYVETKGSGKSDPEKFWYIPQRLRSESAGGKCTIIRLDKKMMITLDPAAKTYREMTFAEMKEMFGASRAKLDELIKKRMESLPPEKRKEMEQRMSGMPGLGGDESKYSVDNTGETRVINGYSCAKYSLKRNGKESEVIWATADVKGMESIRKDMEQLRTEMANVVGSRGFSEGWYTEIKGFPIQTESHGQVRSVTHLERKSIDASMFEAPAGYTKEKTKGFGPDMGDSKD